MGGVLYALFCGQVISIAASFPILCSLQPLVIIGVTGPISIFLETVYSVRGRDTTLSYDTIQVSSSLDLPFFPFLTWIGLWTALMHVALGAGIMRPPLTIAALTNACSLIKYATRFSGEVLLYFCCCCSLTFV